jgi:hypothetical protein
MSAKSRKRGAYKRNATGVVGDLPTNDAPVRRYAFARPRLTCAALDESVRNCNCVTHTHGGLTPAALGRMCVCAP